jgi:hypothetical protein
MTFLSGSCICCHSCSTCVGCGPLLARAYALAISARRRRVVFAARRAVSNRVGGVGHSVRAVRCGRLTCDVELCITLDPHDNRAPVVHVDDNVGAVIRLGHRARDAARLGRLGLPRHVRPGLARDRDGRLPVVRKDVHGDGRHDRAPPARDE